MILAYPVNNLSRRLSDGSYYLVDGNCPGEVEKVKENILELGGRYNHRKNMWVIHERLLPRIPAIKMIKVTREAFCHLPKEIMFVKEADFKVGKITESCPICDKVYDGVKILNNL